MTDADMTMTKDFTFENLNRAYFIWKRKRLNQRFGQFWMNQTGFKLPEDFNPKANLWEEKDDLKAYGFIFDYLLTIQGAGQPS